MNLLKRIETLRAELIAIYGGGKPADDKELVKKSQELDKLIVIEQRARLNRLSTRMI